MFGAILQVAADQFDASTIDAFRFLAAGVRVRATLDSSDDRGILLTLLSGVLSPLSSQTPRDQVKP